MSFDLFLKESNRDWSRGPSFMGASVMTTSEDATNAINQINVDTDNLNVDITMNWYPKVASKKSVSDSSFVNAWIKWRDATYDMIRSTRKFKIVPDMAWSIVDRVAQKTRELAEWRKRFEAISGERSTAPQSEVPASGDGGIWKMVALAAGGAALAGIVFAKIK